MHEAPIVFPFFEQVVVISVGMDEPDQRTLQRLDESWLIPEFLDICHFSGLRLCVEEEGERNLRV